MILTTKFFHSSLIKSFYDVMMNSFQMRNSVDNYISKNFKRENIFISPIFAPEHILEKYPKTLIFCGLEDPIYGHSEIFALKLLENKVDIELYTIPNLGHGFMAFYLPLNYGIQEIGLFIKFMIDIIQQFTNYKQLTENVSFSSTD